jgi:hypothetical protein
MIVGEGFSSGAAHWLGPGCDSLEALEGFCNNVNSEMYDPLPPLSFQPSFAAQLYGARIERTTVSAVLEENAHFIIGLFVYDTV